MVSLDFSRQTFIDEHKRILEAEKWQRVREKADEKNAKKEEARLKKLEAKRQKADDRKLKTALQIAKEYKKMQAQKKKVKIKPKAKLKPRTSFLSSTLKRVKPLKISPESLLKSFSPTVKSTNAQELRRLKQIERLEQIKLKQLKARGKLQRQVQVEALAMSQDPRFQSSADDGFLDSPDDFHNSRVAMMNQSQQQFTNPNQETWIQKIMRGNRSFRSRPLSEMEMQQQNFQQRQTGAQKLASIIRGNRPQNHAPRLQKRDSFIFGSQEGGRTPIRLSLLGSEKFNRPTNTKISRRKASVLYVPKENNILNAGKGRRVVGF